MRVTGTPLSRAEIAVHFPVPFCDQSKWQQHAVLPWDTWPAASLIFSTKYSPLSSLNFSISAVISIKKESRSPLFHSVITYNGRSEHFIGKLLHLRHSFLHGSFQEHPSSNDMLPLWAKQPRWTSFYSPLSIPACLHIRYHYAPS